MTGTIPANRHSFLVVIDHGRPGIESFLNDTCETRDLFLQNPRPPYFPFKSAHPVRPITPGVRITKTKNRLHVAKAVQEQTKKKGKENFTEDNEGNQGVTDRDTQEAQGSFNASFR